jgi:hypothetical protein
VELTAHENRKILGGEKIRGGKKWKKPLAGIGLSTEEKNSVAGKIRFADRNVANKCKKPF